MTMLSPPSPMNLIKATHPCNNHLSDCLRCKDIQKNRDIKASKDILTFEDLELTLIKKKDLDRSFFIIMFLRTYAHVRNILLSYKIIKRKALVFLQPLRE